MRTMAANELDKLIQLIDTLSPTDRQKLTQYLIEDQMHADISDSDDASFTEEEINDLMTITPKTGAEIVEAGLKSGAIGAWADRGVDDPVTWLKQQRLKRKNKYQW